jgi:hypothetical protein
MKPFKTFQEICAYGRKDNICFCGEQRDKSGHVYCHDHWVEWSTRAKTNTNTNPYEVESEVCDWVNGWLRERVNTCATCENFCPADDYLCNDCRA